jgi:hypothetical protein
MKPRALWTRLGVLVPPCALGLFVWHFGVDVPWLDQWELPTLLEKRALGTLRLADFWAPHNEHRLFFPRLIMVGLAGLTDWNIRWELAVILLLALGTFAIFAWKLHRNEAAWALPLVSVLVFSLSQKENWLWGWQIQILLNVLAVVAGLAILSRPNVSTAGVALASALGVVAYYSFANGVAFFPVAVLVLLAAGGARPDRVGLLVSVCAAATMLYLRGFPSAANAPPSTHTPVHVLLALPYALAYLGNPLRVGPTWVAVLLGLLGVATFSWAFRRGRAAAPERAAFALGLAGYAIGSAVITAVGRAGFGVQQAASSRYATIATLFWVGLVLLVSSDARLRRACFGAIAIFLLIADGRGAEQAVYDSLERAAVREALLSRDPDGALRINLPEQEVLRHRPDIELLRAHHLTAFRRGME